MTFINLEHMTTGYEKIHLLVSTWFLAYDFFLFHSKPWNTVDSYALSLPTFNGLNIFTSYIEMPLKFNHIL